MTALAPSAGGLFRATGKAPKVERPRQAHDFEATPPEPTRAILTAERERLVEFPALWEPAAGDGAMVREMRAAGHRVVASDLVDRGCGARIASFYDFAEAPAPALVTNPPFAECSWTGARGRWITHALGELGLDYMALLLPWNWPAAAGLGEIWGRWPPARAYLICWRIDFTGCGAQPASHAWFVWDRAHEGETAFRRLVRLDHRQADLFGEAAE